MDEIVNAIKGLGEKVEDIVVVQKVLRSLPSRYNGHIYAIEEARNLKTLTIDDLHGKLTIIEMRTVDEETFKREIAFKTTRKTKEESSESDSDDSEEVAKHKNTKRGFRKYRGKLPLKYFNCGRVGHFAAKCPYTKDDQVNEEDFKKKYKWKTSYKQRNFSEKKKSLCVNEESPNLELGNESDGEILFMAIVLSNQSDEDNVE